MSRRLLLLSTALALTLGAVPQVFAQSNCPSGPYCCPPDQQFPCKQKQPADTGTVTVPSTHLPHAATPAV